MRAVFFAALGVVGLAACATSSHVLVGTPRAPIAPSEVRVYSDPPRYYDRIAILDASSERSFQFGDQAKVDAAIERLKREAAKLGANGVLFQGTGDKPGVVIGTGGSSVSMGGHSSVGVGLGLSHQMMHKVVHGEAIYVPPNAP